MIQEFPNTDESISAAEAIADPKHIWVDGDIIKVCTGEDVPTNSAPRTIEAWQYRERFTQQQQLAIMHYAIDGVDDMMRLSLMSLWTATQGVDLDSDKVKAGLAYCVTLGILTKEEADTIRA